MSDLQSTESNAAKETPNDTGTCASLCSAIGLLILRVSCGGLMLVHGIPKLMGFSEMAGKFIATEIPATKFDNRQQMEKWRVSEVRQRRVEQIVKYEAKPADIHFVTDSKRGLTCRDGKL